MKNMENNVAQNDKSSTQMKIFEASIKLFSDLGYARVSMRDIAKSVGISVAAIYNHFPSKDSLLDAMYDFFSEQQEKALPNMEEILERCATAPINELFKEFAFFYNEDIREKMDRIVAIASEEARADERSARFIEKSLLRLPDIVAIPILQRLIDKGRIEPIELEGVRILLSNFAYAGAVRNYSLFPIDLDDWTKGMNTILSLVKPID